MRKLIVNEWMTLDGVVQAPGAGRIHYRRLRTRRLASALLRRPLPEVGRGEPRRRRRLPARAPNLRWLRSLWPKASEEEQVIAQPLNTKPKYVAPRTLREPLSWQNSTLLQDDLVKGVLALKQEAGADLQVLGSTELVRRLIELSLVDEFRLMVDPLLVGCGKRIFPDDGRLRPLRLVDSHVTSTGAILATYAPEES